MVADGRESTGDGDDGVSGAREGSEAAASESTPAEGPRDGPTDEEVVAAASDAAEGLVFSRYSSSEVRDVDVTVRFEEGVLEVDVYLNVPDADAEEHVEEEAERVADDAALAAVDAVDRLFEEYGQ